ncbi:MAG: T9SS C-terminal target domain-containing protein, partial [Bacteroidetes bacterium]
DPFTPDGQGTYAITAYAQLSGATDEVPENDTLRYTLQVTESLLARDDGIHNGGSGYVVSSSSTAMAVVLHSFPVSAPLIGIDIEIETPQHGDTTYAVFVATTGGAPTMAPFFTGDPVILDSNVNEYFLPLPFTLTLPPGTYGIGVYEDEAGIFLRQSQNVFTPGVNYFSTDLTTWTASGIATARFIRPRIADCAGFTLDLTMTPDNGTGNGTATVGGTIGPVTYLWDDPNSQSGSMAMGLTPGTYTVTVTDSVGCTYRDSIEVTACTSIALDLSSTPDNGTGNGTATVGVPLSSATYMWNDPNNQTGSTAVGLSAGLYTVTVTDSTGCVYVDSIEVLSNVGIGAALAGIDFLQLTPNPTQGLVQLQLDLRQAQAVQLSLYDELGRLVHNQELSARLQHRETLDLQQLPAGVYLLQVRTPLGSVTQRLLRQ